ncbi:MAG: hypothetical protein LBM60_03630, partial [Clostridium sp.]|nr:hypothetical protein [Clostridium sp.]
IEWTINPKPITVVPTAATRKVGEANPDFTIELAEGSALTEADLLAYGANALAHAAGEPTFTCGANAASMAGEYDITINYPLPAGKEGSTNYAVTYTGTASTGTFTITQDTITTGDYTITPSSYTPSTWTNQTITVAPSATGSYSKIRSVAANGTKSAWGNTLTVTDQSTNLKFELQTATGAISTAQTLSLQSDSSDPTSAAPVITANQQSGIITVTIELSDALSGIDETSVTLKQTGDDVAFTIADDIVTFRHTQEQEYQLTFADIAGNESSETFSVGIGFYNMTFDAGAGENEESPIGNDPAALTLWQGKEYTLPQNPYTLEGYLFTGWDYQGQIYLAGETFVMPAAHVALSAKWILANQSVDLTGALLYQNGRAVADAKVELVQDETLITQTRSNDNGVFTFSDFASGVYELSVTVEDIENGDQTLRVRIIAQDGQITLADTGQELGELLIVQPESVVAFETAVRNLLPNWRLETQDQETIKQTLAGNNETRKDRLINEIRDSSGEIHELSQIFDSFSQIKTTQIFQDTLAHWSQIIEVYANITLVVESNTSLTYVGDADPLLGLLITQDDLEQLEQGVVIEITMRIEDVTDEADNEDLRRSMALLQVSTTNEQKISRFFEITIEKTVGGETTLITQTGTEVELIFWIPEYMRDGSEYQVLRNHNGTVSALRTRQNGYYLYAYSDEFSTYAIAYVPNATGAGQGGSLSEAPTIVITSPKTAHLIMPTGISNTVLFVPKRRRRRVYVKSDDAFHF